MTEPSGSDRCYSWEVLQLLAGRYVNYNSVSQLLSKQFQILGDDFQRFNLLAIQFKEESEIHGAAWKVAG